MLEIIKYQLKGRKNAMLLLGSIFAIVNAIAFAFETREIAVGRFLFNSSLTFWIVMAIGVTVISTIVLLFQCSSGHVEELLYKDTNYLMLTIPRHGWEVLGGRLIAGFLEYAIFAIASAVLMSFHITFGTVLGTKGGVSFFPTLGLIYQQLLVVNFYTFAQIVLIMLCSFISVGVFLTFATVASRSFIKNKGIATTIAVVVFITVMNFAIKFGTFISEKLNWFTKISFTLDRNCIPAELWNQSNISIMMRDASIPIAPFLLFIALAAILFVGASWLMEKKVEL